MLRVKTTIGPSSIHGTGLFADQLIPKGTVTWEYDPKLDVSITKEELDKLPQPSKDYFLYYSYYDKERDIYVLPTDALRFINHSEDASKRNIDSTPDKDVANRDIMPGEELLCDYRLFDDLYFGRIGLTADKLK